MEKAYAQDREKATRELDALDLGGDRPDHDVALGEVGLIGREGRQSDVEGLDLALLDLAREEVLDAATRLLPQLVDYLAADGLSPRARYFTRQENAGLQIVP